VSEQGWQPLVTLGGSALEAAIYGLLFKPVAEATLTIAADPKRLGARSPSPLCLNSWGSAMTSSHVHMVVPRAG
jgi:hypothetical protein